MQHPPAKTQQEVHAAAMLSWITRTVVPYLPVTKSLSPALEVSTSRYLIAGAVGAYWSGFSGMQTHLSALILRFQSGLVGDRGMRVGVDKSAKLEGRSELGSRGLARFGRSVNDELHFLRPREDVPAEFWPQL